jgi:hypothetical protein
VNLLAARGSSARYDQPGGTAALFDQSGQHRVGRIVLAFGHKNDFVIAVILRQIGADVRFKIMFQSFAGQDDSGFGLIARGADGLWRERVAGETHRADKGHDALKGEQQRQQDKDDFHIHDRLTKFCAKIMDWASTPAATRGGQPFAILPEESGNCQYLYLPGGFSVCFGGQISQALLDQFADAGRQLAAKCQPLGL